MKPVRLDAKMIGCMLAVVAFIVLLPLVSNRLNADVFVPVEGPEDCCSEECVPHGRLQGLYVKFEDVDGECQEMNHVRWCDAISFSLGMSTPTSGGGGTGRPVERVELEDVVVVKEVDKAVKVDVAVDEFTTCRETPDLTLNR